MTDPEGSDGAEPGFEPGVRLRDRSFGSWSSSANMRAHDEISRAVDMAGFVRLPGVDVIEERLQRAALILFEPLTNLLNRSFDAVDPVTRHQQTLRILQIPLPGGGSADSQGSVGRGSDEVARRGSQRPPSGGALRTRV